jgi:hypothetical protein
MLQICGRKTVAKPLWSSLLVGIYLLLGISRSEATTYNFSYPSIFGVSGSITTDGTTGVLTAANITSWTYSQTDSTFLGTASGTGAGVGVTLTGDALTANATQLLFNFGETANPSLFELSGNFGGPSGDTDILEFCDANGNQCKDQNGFTSSSRLALVLIAGGLGSTSFGIDESTAGNAVIATASVTETPTPLPAALPLFATGIGGLGLLGWRRKRKARAA